VAKQFQVAIDCADPAALSDFWAEVLGYVHDAPPEGFSSWPEALAAWGIPEEDWNSANALVDPDGVGPRIFFQRVPEAKVGKNRIHLDVRVSAGPNVPVEDRRPVLRAEVDRVVALGATEIGEVEEQGGVWVVMQDPEGNEFDIT
jgi:hypothetical protein